LPPHHSPKQKNARRGGRAKDQITMQEMAQQEPQRNSPTQKTDADGGIIAEWPLNTRESARVSIEKYNGVWLINLRKWFEAESGEMRPGKQGIALGMRHLPQLAEAVTTALSIARQRGLVEAKAAREIGK
jgi:hypothetical protein